MRAVIVGLGSIGRRHLANLRDIEPGAFITLWHQHSRASDNQPREVRADRTVFELAEVLETRPDLAVLASPASAHVCTALELAARNIHPLPIRFTQHHTTHGRSWGHAGR